MIELIQFWGTIAIGSVLAILSWSWVVWPIVKARWGTSMPTMATTAGNKIAALVDQGSMLLALSDVYALARKRGDTKIIDLCSQIRLQSATWDDDVPAVSVAPLTSVESIIADAVAKVQEAAK